MVLFQQKIIQMLIRCPSCILGIHKIKVTESFKKRRFSNPYTPTYLSVYLFLGKNRLVSHLRTGSSYHFNAA